MKSTIAGKEYSFDLGYYNNSADPEGKAAAAICERNASCLSVISPDTINSGDDVKVAVEYVLFSSIDPDYELSGHIVSLAAFIVSTDGTVHLILDPDIVLVLFDTTEHSVVHLRGVTIRIGYYPSMSPFIVDDVSTKPINPANFRTDLGPIYHGSPE